MSAIPVTGQVRLLLGAPPRDSTVEFRDHRRVVVLPVSAAVPVLSRARARDDLRPETSLLAGAALLALQVVASGRLAPGAGDSWEPVLGPDDERRIRALATADGRAEEAASEAEEIVRGLLAAVADAMPRRPPGAERPQGRAPVRGAGRGAASVMRPPPEEFARRLQDRIDRSRRAVQEAARPQLVTLSLRIEADEEELVAGAVRIVPQVHDADNALHVADAAELWLDPGGAHGFGDRARTHAQLALRAAADAWPPLERLLELRVPEEITLDTDELVSLLDEGAAALQSREVDVLWPRSLGRDLTVGTVLDHRAAAPREGDLVKPMFGTEDLFAFRWQVALGGDPLTDEEMDRLADAASPILKIRGNWTVVDPSMARKAKKRLVRTVRPAQAIAAALTGIVEVEDEEETVVVGASLLDVRRRLEEAATRDPVPVPALLRATLRDYQRHGLTWLADLTDLGLGACLADDMGLGKTVTLIALHLHRQAHGHGGPTLVVCPTSLLGNWQAEIARFAPEIAVRRFHGSRRDLTDLTGPHAPQGTVVLTTYGTLRSDAAADAASDTPALASVDWDLVVADEAQHVKNPRAAAARALRGVAEGTTARVALTGTPVENNLTDLWAILDWAIPGLLGSRLAFRRVWAAPIESGLEPSKAAAFADLIDPFVLRRRKTDPGIAPELPEKTETDHPLSLTREQVVLYESFVRDTMERIERADPMARRGLVLALLTGLKQICNHPAQFLRQARPRLAGRSEKFEAVEEIVTTAVAEGGGVLLFTQYVALGRLLESLLTGAGLEHQFLHGQTPVRQREEMVHRFQTAEQPPVFLLSLKAGGVGLNLTRADHVVHVDRWWNPAVEEQATDRAYRIGQTRPVFVHRLITRGTIEERIAQLLTRKRALADAVLARGEAALTELDDAELRDLVTLRPVDP